MEGRPLDDDDLVERARNGDVNAYEQLVVRYQQLAVRTAYLIAGPAEAEDAAQEAFVKAFYALDRFRVGAPFKPWILKIVVNEARNRRKSAGRRELLALRASEGHPSGDAAPSPESVVLRDEQSLLLSRALELLNEKDRTLISLRYFLELTEAEMAQALRIPTGTVKSRLSRAMSRLRSRTMRAGEDQGDGLG